jgi:hypothetical protein
MTDMDDTRESIRIGVKKTGMRWQRARQTLDREDRPYADRLTRMAEAHTTRGAPAFDDPLEAAVYSVFLEMLKELERKKDRGEGIRAG